MDILNVDGATFNPMIVINMGRRWDAKTALQVVTHTGEQDDPTFMITVTTRRPAMRAQKNPHKQVQTTQQQPAI